MSKTIATIAACLALFAANGAANLYLGAGIHTYGLHGETANGGVVAGDCYHFDVGFELWGADAGPFVNQC